jgi:predicted heme/steroid binding protein
VLAGLAGCGTQAGQSASQATGQEELVLTPDELAAYNGKDGMSAYIAVDGLIYDVTNVSQWKNGEHNGFSAGKDLTREIKEISPHGLSKLDLVPQVGRLADSNAKPNLMFFILLGWINFSLFVLVTSHFWLRFLNKHLFHAKSKNFLGLLKRLRNIHKPIGIALAGSVFVHGYLALGAIRPHTGLMAATALAVAAAFGAAYFFSRKKTFFTLHRWTVLVVACLIAVHLIFPNLLYTLFGV